MRPYLLFHLLLLSISGVISAEILTEGIAYPKNDIELSAPVDDVVIEILANEGDFVRKGELLVKYEHSKEDLTVEQSALQKLKYESDYKNAKELADKNIFTADRVQELEYQAVKAGIELKLAKALRLGKEVFSPISGILVEKNIDVGERSPKGTAICRVIDTSSLWLNFYVSTDLLNKVKLDKSYQVQFPEVSNQTFLATSSYISPEIDARSGLFKVRLIFDNKNNEIKAGSRVLANFND